MLKNFLIAVVFGVIFLSLSSGHANKLPVFFDYQGSVDLTDTPYRNFTGLRDLQIGRDGRLRIFQTRGPIRIIDPVDGIFLNGDDNYLGPYGSLSPNGELTHVSILLPDGNLLSSGMRLELEDDLEPSILTDPIDGIFFNGDDIVQTVSPILPQFGIWQGDPRTAAMGPDGKIYIPPIPGTNPPQVDVYDPIDGDYTNDNYAIYSIEFPAFSSNRLYTGIAFDDRGNLFLCQKNGELMVIDPVDGIFANGNDVHKVWDVQPTIVPYLEPSPSVVEVRGIAFDKQNNLIMVDSGYDAFIVSTPIYESSTEVVLDFGPGIGVWSNYNDDPIEWSRIHSMDVELMATGDIDNDGKDDVVLDFGSDYGVWVNYNDDPASWRRIHSLSPELIIIADIDRNGQDDVIFDFGSTGLWVNYNDDPASWRRIHSLSPEGIAVGTINDSGENDIVIDFGSDYGVWLNIAADVNEWKMIHPGDPEHFLLGDLDNSGQDDMIFDFGSAGVWVYYNDDSTSWKQIDSSDPELMANGDLDNNGFEELILSVAGEGVKAIYNNDPGDWRQIHSLNPELINVSNIDNNNKDDVIMDFGSLGLWVNYNDDPVDWRKIHPFSPESMVTGNLDGN